MFSKIYNKKAIIACALFASISLSAADMGYDDMPHMQEQGHRPGGQSVRPPLGGPRAPVQQNTDQDKSGSGFSLDLRIDEGILQARKDLSTALPGDLLGYILAGLTINPAMIYIYNMISDLNKSVFSLIKWVLISSAISIGTSIAIAQTTLNPVMVTMIIVAAMATIDGLRSTGKQYIMETGLCTLILNSCIKNMTRIVALGIGAASVILISDPLIIAGICLTFNVLPFLFVYVFGFSTATKNSMDRILYNILITICTIGGVMLAPQLLPMIPANVLQVLNKTFPVLKGQIAPFMSLASSVGLVAYAFLLEILTRDMSNSDEVSSDANSNVIGFKQALADAIKKIQPSMTSGRLMLEAASLAKESTGFQKQVASLEKALEEVDKAITQAEELRDENEDKQRRIFDAKFAKAQVETKYRYVKHFPEIMSSFAKVLIKKEEDFTAEQCVDEIVGFFNNNSGMIGDLAKGSLGIAASSAASAAETVVGTVATGVEGALALTAKTAAETAGKVVEDAAKAYFNNHPEAVQTVIGLASEGAQGAREAARSAGAGVMRSGATLFTGDVRQGEGFPGLRRQEEGFPGLRRQEEGFLGFARQGESQT